MRSRIEPADPESLYPDLRAVVRAATSATTGAGNLYGILARTPGLARRYLPFSGKLFTKGKLEARTREIAILRTAWRCRSDYEWGQHERIAREFGLSGDDIRAVAEEVPAARWSPFERAVMAACDELVADHRVGDRTWAELCSDLDDASLIELVMLVGNYVMLAGLLASAGAERESGVASLPQGPSGRRPDGPATGEPV